MRDSSDPADAYKSQKKCNSAGISPFKSGCTSKVHPELVGIGSSNPKGLSSLEKIENKFQIFFFK